MKMRSSYFAIAFAVGAFVWTAAGETFDPVLSARELPLGIVKDCESRAICDLALEYNNRWIGKTREGELFLVSRGACSADAAQCNAWFVEKTPKDVTTLLRVNGEFRLLRSEGFYPVVQARTQISESQSAYSYYEWLDGRYVRSGHRIVYRVGDVECGTTEQCYQAAREAVNQRRYGKAVRIWETVHDVSWI